MHFLADHAIKELPSITGLPVPARLRGEEAEAGRRRGKERVSPGACLRPAAWTGGAAAAPGRAGA